MGVGGDAEGWEREDVQEAYRGRGEEVGLGLEGVVGFLWVGPFHPCIP